MSTVNDYATDLATMSIDDLLKLKRKQEQIKEWNEKNLYLSKVSEEVDTLEFYEDLYGYYVQSEDEEYNGMGKVIGIFLKPNPNYAEENRVVNNDSLIKVKKKQKKLIANHFYATEGLQEILDVLDYDVSFLSPVTYFGRSNTAANARLCHAFVFDLDYVGMQQLKNLLKQINTDYIPKPSYIVNSGTGLHLYYIFEEPIPMYPAVQITLKELKTRLIDKVWNSFTSRNEERQYQGIVQGYRVIGSPTKLGKDYRVKAYRFNNGDKTTIWELNEYLNNQPHGGNDNRMDLSDIRAKSRSKLTLSEAREKWPEWYEDRIINKRQRNTWTCKRDLYDWWKRKITDEVKAGHRYHSIMALCAYARKCGISYEELEQDAYNFIGLLDERSDEKHDSFTADDVEAALKLYDEQKRDGKTIVNYTREYIAKQTAVEIPKNQRNGRKQSVHIKYMNNQRAFKFNNGECTNGGRPKGSGISKQKIKLWRDVNPNGTKKQCKDETGLSYPTIRKWWDSN